MTTKRTRFPRAIIPERVGRYPATAYAGGGFVWDAVLEYRVWCHPERGAPEAYYDLETGKYLKDYDKILTGKLPSTYHVQDTWENYDLIKPQIDKRFAAWKKKRKTKK